MRKVKYVLHDTMHVLKTIHEGFDVVGDVVEADIISVLRQNPDLAEAVRLEMGWVEESNLRANVSYQAGFGAGIQYAGTITCRKCGCLMSDYEQGFKDGDDAGYYRREHEQFLEKAGAAE